MRLVTAANRRASRSLAGHGARDVQFSPSVRQLPKIYRALPAGDVAPDTGLRSSAGDSFCAANVLRRRLLAGSSMQRRIPRGGRRSHVGPAVWVGTGAALLLLLIAAHAVPPCGRASSFRRRRRIWFPLAPATGWRAASDDCRSRAVPPPSRRRGAERSRSGRRVCRCRPMSAPDWTVVEEYLERQRAWTDLGTRARPRGHPGRGKVAPAAGCVVRAPGNPPRHRGGDGDRRGGRCARGADRGRRRSSWRTRTPNRTRTGTWPWGHGRWPPTRPASRSGRAS